MKKSSQKFMALGLLRERLKETPSSRLFIFDENSLFEEELKENCGQFRKSLLKDFPSMVHSFGACIFRVMIDGAIHRCTVLDCVRLDNEPVNCVLVSGLMLVCTIERDEKPDEAINNDLNGIVANVHV